MSNNYNWNQKENRSKLASEHTMLMKRKYQPLIDFSVNHSLRYFVDHENYFNGQKRFCHTNISVEPIDSVTAIIRNQKHGKCAVLNFASHKNPGGMFLQGSRAQEECLCHASTLYNVLSDNQLESYYAFNNRNKNRGMYVNSAIYSPNILFIENDSSCMCDVITCAAPNKRAGMKYCNITEEENIFFLKSRIKFVLDIAAFNYVDTLILGAYGCGVFGQDPYQVATIFNDLLCGEYCGCFERVIFAIPVIENNRTNYEAFFEFITHTAK